MADARRCARAALLCAAVSIGLAVASSAQHAIVADLNGDGVPDRVDLGPGSFQILVHTSGRSRPQSLNARDWVVSLAVADVNHDGRPDIVATTSRLGLRVWVNRGRGKFAFARRHTTPTRQVRSRSGAKGSTPFDSDDLSGGTHDQTTSLVHLTETSADLAAPAKIGCGDRAPTDDLRIRPRIPRGPPLSRLS